MPTYVVRSAQKANLEVNEKGARVYNRQYIIESSVTNDTELDILNQSPHAYYSAHPTDSLALLKKAKVSQTADLNFWTLDLTWDTEQAQQDRGTMAPASGGTSTGPPTEPGTNNSLTAPNLRPWSFKWDSITRQQPLTYDNAGIRICNSAGQQFDPPIETPITHPTLHITGYRATEFRDSISTLTNKVNDAAFLEWAAGTVLCTKYVITSVYENGAWYWQIDVDLEMNPDGWNPVKVLDQGTYTTTRRDAIAGPPPVLNHFDLPAPQRPVDRRGQPFDGKVLLDGAGAQLPWTGTPVFLEFNVYSTVSFSTPNLISRL